MSVRYAVIATQYDGPQLVWGGFSAARADLAANALLELEGVESVSVRPLMPPAALTAELGDWARAPRPGASRFSSGDGR